MENLLEYLEASAARFPDKTAVAYRQQELSYAELYRCARACAGAIGKTDKAVGVIAGRGTETIAFFFAVLYSGGFYVPIDPDMPEDKLAAVLSDSGADTVLGMKSDEDKLRKTGFTGRYLTEESFLAEECEVPKLRKDTPAYMVYTSGSTGKPKGVLKSHGAVISFIEAYTKTFDFSCDEVIGNQTPFFFDASAKDIYLTIKLGATMEILPSTLFTLPPELIDYLNEKKVTFASWVPTAISIVAQLNPFSMVKPTTLKKLFFVGEVMPMKHLNKWREALPDIQYVNLYGQSELAGICCYYEVKKQFDNAEVLPMGVPLSNSEIYLVNDGKVVTESGQEGEMYIVSDALALGYYNDEEKTQASFLMRDFGNGEVRCFKTGDYARRDDDGNLIFASRRDHQIKHMGHRIELGEIEAVAGSLPEIQRCCCLYNAQKRKIVMFCELSEDSTLRAADIQHLLKERLSSYMVPGKVNIMEKLPLNKNGKIDRQGLKELI